ncbi:MAG: PEP-CTERM sorting domain-containing protein [Bryobacterales bacterium]|nr:PEP-CTERM sorting domain-containing protein [Bryobacterales bacterium]
MFKASALLGALLAPSFVFAATLSTTTANNGSGGVFMNFTAGAAAISVTGFDAYFESAGSPISVEVYTRPGSYVGFDNNAAGWTLHETMNTTSAGPITLAPPLTLTTPISIGAGQTVAIYLHSISPVGMRYNGTGGSISSHLERCQFSVFSDRARTGSTPFGGSLFTPRTFAGNIHYNVDGEVPEPGTVTFLALGLAGLTLLRRRSN